ncbi:MAG: HAD-IA family hydrolase [Alphaproteobacteria bacterium]|nr:HAD-IA family hydrolase [Alphaproteobacteria bacterium]
METRLDGVAVVFDLDGTLIDTAGDLAAAMNHALALDGLPPLATSRVRHMVGHGAKAMMAEGYRAHGRDAGDANLETRLADFLAYYEAHIDDLSKPFDGALEAIDRLRRAGCRTAICTNKRERPARLLIERLGLSGIFDAIVGGDTAAGPKPDPSPVELAVKRAGGATCVFIGDSDTDILAAMAAGAPCLVAEFGYGPLTLRDRAFATFSNFGAVPDLVADAARRSAPSNG